MARGAAAPPLIVAKRPLISLGAAPGRYRARPVTGEPLADELRKRYDGGESIRSLAESTKRSYGFVHRLLSESGATLRSRGGANRNSKKA